MNTKIFKKALCLMLALLLAVGQMGTVLAANDGFSDMPDASHWAHEALQKAVENGLLKGSHGKLHPEKALTRAELATIVNRAFGAYETADISGYEDVYSGIGIIRTSQKLSTWAHSRAAAAE